MIQIAGGILIAAAVLWVVLKVLRSPGMFLSGIIKAAIFVLVMITIYMIAQAI